MQWLAVLLCVGPAVATGGDGRGPGSVEVETGRTTTVEVRPDVGRPVELAAGPRSSYALAVTRDREERWAEAAAQYQTAANEWSIQYYRQPSQASETAMRKAERERNRSQILAAMQVAAPGPSGLAFVPLTLERARLLRMKLMAVRAFTGSVPETLYRHARDALTDALRLAPAQRSAPAIELRILLAATLAVGGELDTARFELAHVRTADREDPAQAIAMATYQAAAGDLDTALDLLEVATRRMDPESAREVYLRNDWDRLRGQPRFERLFTR